MRVRESTELLNRSILEVVGNSEFGGGSRVILSIAAGAIAQGAKVDILTTNARMIEEAHAIGAGTVPLDCIQRSINPLRDARGVWRLRKLLRRRHYDIVHTHTTKAGVVGRLAAAWARVPMIVHTIHGFAFHDRSAWWLIKGASTVERIMATFSNLVVTVSRYHFEWALDLGAVPPDKLVVIPNAVERAPAAPASVVGDLRNELLDGRSRLILYHGRMAHQKGLEDLLRALSVIRDRDDELLASMRVVLAGDGPALSEYRELVREMDLEEAVRFLGFRSDVDLLLNAADVVVQPSHREGLSIAVLEALARGCVTIASDIPSNRELIMDRANGRLFPVGDVSALARVVREVFEHPGDWADWSIAAQELIRDRHSLERMQEAYCRIYADGGVGRSRE